MGSVAAETPTPGQVPDGGAVERLQRRFDRLARRKGIGHTISVVESTDGRFRWAGVAGRADGAGTPMTVATPFHVASIDKVFVACVVMKLVERGRLRLDDPLAACLAPALIDGLHRLNGVDHTGAITIAHLLSHTSGLADCFEDRPRGGRSLMEGLLHDGDRAWTLNDLAAIVRDDLRPHFPPQPLDGKRPRVRYSDTNFQLLVAVAEAVSGQPLHRLFEDWLFRPLGLRHSHVLGHSQPLDPTPPPAALWFDGRPLDLPLALPCFPSLYCTAGDLLTFLRALVDGTVFDDRETAGLMQRRWNRFGIAVDPAALRAPGWPIEYGLGLMRFRLPRAFTPFRSMPALIGHTGSTGSWLFHCPERHLLLCGTVDDVTAGAVPYRFTPAQLRACAGQRGWGSRRT